ncbi:NAD(P)H-binding protein OS=Streptomyces tendae OX=1932 GN=GUR47_11475 PE=4 SV=1 [Streptomyces tendae]
MADLAEPAGLRPALAGAKSLFLLLSGDLHALGASPADIVAEAADGGVRRIVLLSTLGVVTRPFGATRIAMRELEDKVRESGLQWALLRPGGFASNALWWAESVRERRVVAAPFGDVGVPVIDPADIAAVAAACLLEDRYIGGAYELTGPEVITPRGQTEAIAAALGSPVAFHELTRDEARAAMARSMPAELADDTLDILGNPSPAEQRVSPDVERVLGRAPRPFADWAARNVTAVR